MARTPLLDTFVRLFREHRSARTAGLTLAALRERRAASSNLLSRREVLAGGAATAITAILPRRLAAAGDPTVAIVGGGIAGLTCALALADHGITSRVYEASGRIGGRMFTTADYFAQGQVAEWGGELIDTGHTTVRKLAKRFGLPLDNLLSRPAAPL